MPHNLFSPSVSNKDRQRCLIFPHTFISVKFCDSSHLHKQGGDTCNDPVSCQQAYMESVGKIWAQCQALNDRIQHRTTNRSLDLSCLSRLALLTISGSTFNFKQASGHHRELKTVQIVPALFSEVVKEDSSMEKRIRR